MITSRLSLPASARWGNAVTRRHNYGSRPVSTVIADGAGCHRDQSLADIVAELDALNAADFDLWSQDANGWELLAGLCEELEQHAVHDGASIAPELLGSSWSGRTARDIGSPGPVVHLLQRLAGYERHLEQSLARRPSQGALWMANRILDTAADRGTWLDLLRTASADATLPAETRDSAREFFDYQLGSDQRPPVAGLSQ